ncbi:hypothetical protein PVK06_027370 [Gossypium arboreum]|uniref:Uncharacterized protein n=1 Tax=Gossypium arboreum TaxID=29729 RepID=A0ABR0P3K7_GOSAR|nr:hypothetical protein PVK06_027370 [Gossypium arboreum]
MVIFLEQLEVNYVFVNPPVTKEARDSTIVPRDLDVDATTKAKFDKDNRTHKKLDISLEELISHMKIKEVNRLKDKALITSNEFYLKVNLVEFGFGPKFNRLKTTKISKKNVKLQNKKAVNFKKSEKNKSNNFLNCYMCGKFGNKTYQCYQCYQRSDH